MNIKKLLTFAFAALLLVCSADVEAQRAKDDRKAKSSLRDNAIRDARKEAKKYQKMGYTTMIGKIMLDKQIENAWMAQVKKDQNGDPAFFIATAKAVGGNYNAAKMQADNLAKLDLAGQIGTKVSQIIEANIVNNDLGEGDVETLNNAVSASKSVIAQTLGRTYPYVEIYKNLADNKVEVLVTIGYDMKKGVAETKKVLRTKLEGKSAKLAQDLDKYLPVSD